MQTVIGHFQPSKMVFLGARNTLLRRVLRRRPIVRVSVKTEVLGRLLRGGLS